MALLCFACTSHGGDEPPSSERAPELVAAPVAAAPEPAPPELAPPQLPDPPHVTVSPSKRLRHGGDVLSIAFDPAGERIATGSGDALVRIWSRSGKLLETLGGHSDGVTGVAWSPDGQRLASASFDRTVKLWDPSRGETIFGQTFQDRMRAVSFDPRGGQLAMAGDYVPITLRDLTSSSSLVLTSLPNSDDQNTWDMRFSHRGDRILSLGSGRLRVWDVDHNDLLWEAKTGSTSAVWRADFSFDDQFVIASVEEQRWRVVIWSVESGERVREYDFADAWLIPAVAFSPAGHIAAGDAEGLVSVWNPLASEELVRAQKLDKNIIDLAFSPDGRTLAAGGYDNVVQLWDVASQTDD